MIKLWIEDQEMDTTEGFSHQITYAIDDLNNLDSKATSFSKTIILPGTSNNNTLLGNIFEFSNSNFTGPGSNVFYNFDASRSAKCRLDINNLTIIKGALRLLEIVRMGDSIEYEVAIFGELGGFVSKLANKKLEDLDFSLYNHVYDDTNISDRWKSLADIKISYNSCTLSFNQITILGEGDLSDIFITGDEIEVFNSETMISFGTFTITSVNYTRFGSGYFNIILNTNIINYFLNIPLTFTVKNKGGGGVYYPLIDYGNYSVNKHDFQIKTFRPALYVKEYLHKIITEAGYTYDSEFFKTDFFKRLIIPHNQSILETIKSNLFSGTFIDKSDAYAYYSTPISASVNIPINKIYGDLFTTSDNIEYTYIGPPVTMNFNISVIVELIYNSGNVNLYATGTYNTTIWVIKNNIATSVVSNASGNLFVSRRPGQPIYLGSASRLITVNGEVSLNTNDVIAIESGFAVYPDNHIYGTSYVTRNIKSADSSISINSLYPIVAPIDIGDILEVNRAIPKNIQQKDFFTSIIKMFNLMVTEDKLKNNHLKIEPYIWFYNLNISSYLDWSMKMDRNQAIKIRPMSEVNARFYDFKYKTDNDYYNEFYRKRYNETYGDRRYDNQLEFAKDSQSMEVIFAPTPLLGYEGEDKIIPTIIKWNGGTVGNNEERVNSVIRIMQCKSLTASSNWDLLSGENVLFSTNTYPYAGHFDDPFTPNIDLNFGSVKELFYTLNSGTLGNNTFNIYYSPYMAEITDKDSRLVIAKFKLTDTDIFNLDFKRFIWLDGVLYRLSKIIDYTPGEICTVELLRVVNTTYGSSVNSAEIPEVVICNNIWSKKNLDELFYNMGEEILEYRENVDWNGADTEEIGAWCYYDNDFSVGRKYGKLYNWYAVNKDDKLAPEGWRIPTIDDAEELLACYSNDAKKYKESGLAHWNLNNGTNESGFTALGAGYRRKTGVFDQLKNEARFWLKNEKDASEGYYLQIKDDGSWGIDSAYKREGYSVRLIRKQ